ncbi:MAG: MerR family transcriptional regulator, partial [Acidimicrobiales bacterium]
MTTRTHLSIGDVLTLLRQEFPDVTISKIRFLESQGLVNPERSPSGYRKFYDHDVERLRWVLQQQREHFLPLKVIRDRLASGGGSDGSITTGPETSGSTVTGVVEREEPSPADEEVLLGVPAGADAEPTYGAAAEVAAGPGPRGNGGGHPAEHPHVHE